MSPPEGREERAMGQEVSRLKYSLELLNPDYLRFKTMKSGRGQVGNDLVSRIGKEV